MEKPVVTILCRTGGESQKRKFPLDYPPGIWYYIRCIQYAPVAQLDRASDSDSEGRAFESHQAYHQTESGRNSRSDSILFLGIVLAFIAGIFFCSANPNLRSAIRDRRFFFILKVVCPRL